MPHETCIGVLSVAHVSIPLYSLDDWKQAAAVDGAGEYKEGISCSSIFCFAQDIQTFVYLVDVFNYCTYCTYKTKPSPP